MDASYERHEPHGWGGGMNFYGNMPDTYKVSVNANHKLVNKILSADEVATNCLAKQAFDLALLAQGLLKGADLTAFVERSVRCVVRIFTFFCLCKRK
jgi:molecular chaperone HtpG